MIVRFDKEDDLFIFPTIVVVKYNTEYFKAINIHLAWLHHSVVFMPKVKDK